MKRTEYHSYLSNEQVDALDDFKYHYAKSRARQKTQKEPEKTPSTTQRNIQHLAVAGTLALASMSGILYEKPRMSAQRASALDIPGTVLPREDSPSANSSAAACVCMDASTPSQAGSCSCGCTCNCLDTSNQEVFTNCGMEMDTGEELQPTSNATTSSLKPQGK